MIELTFQSDISIKPCIWGKRWVGEVDGIEIEVDFTKTYIEGGVFEEVKVHPPEFKWVLDKLNISQYMPVVDTTDILNCLANRLAFFRGA